jgi:hypothetical protein
MAADVLPELQVLASKLMSRPAVKLPAGKRLTVYGYVRTEETAPAYASACADFLTWWSAGEGWHLGAIFRDLGVGSETLMRPGFSGLLDVLRLPDSAGVAIVDSTHLSGIPSVAKRLALAVRRTGTTVRVLADEDDPCTAP